MKRKIVFLFVVLLLSASCESIEEVDIIGIPQMEVLGFKDDGIMIGIGLHLRNPNDKTLTVRKGNFRVKINGEEVGRARLSEKVKIRPSSVGFYTFPVHASFNGKKISLDLLKEVFRAGRIDLEIEGKIVAGSYPLVGYTIPVSHRESVNF